MVRMDQPVDRGRVVSSGRSKMDGNQCQLADVEMAAYQFSRPFQKLQNPNQKVEEVRRLDHIAWRHMGPSYIDLVA